jgi:hypothetical protein
VGESSVSVSVDSCSLSAVSRLQPAQAEAEAGRVETAAVSGARDADGHRQEGDKANARAFGWHELQPSGTDSPSADDLAWIAEQEKDHEEALAGFEWDTAERREQFAASLQGKADRTAVDARVLADVSHGTHPARPSVQARVMPPSPARITARPSGPS